MLEGIIRESIEISRTRELRQDGYLIANIYGKGSKNINAAFKSNEFKRAVRAKTTLSFEVSVSGKTHVVVVQDYQVDPLTNELVHVDLKLVTKDLSNYMVPVVTKGLAKGIKEKGVLMHGKRRLKVKCKGADLPNSFELEIAPLNIGDYILVRDIEVPKGVKLLEKAAVAVVGVIKAK